MYSSYIALELKYEVDLFQIQNCCSLLEKSLKLIKRFCRKERQTANDDKYLESEYGGCYGGGGC